MPFGSGATAAAGGVADRPCRRTQSCTVRWAIVSSHGAISRLRVEAAPRAPGTRKHLSGHVLGLVVVGDSRPDIPPDWGELRPVYVREVGSAPRLFDRHLPSLLASIEYFVRPAERSQTVQPSAWSEKNRGDDPARVTASRLVPCPRYAPAGWPTPARCWAARLPRWCQRSNTFGSRSAWSKWLPSRRPWTSRHREHLKALIGVRDGEPYV